MPSVKPILAEYFPWGIFNYSDFSDRFFDSGVHRRRHGRPRSVSPDLRNRNVDRRVGDLCEAQ